MNIGERIFIILEEKGLKQAELSKNTGIPKTTINGWKSKGTNPTAEKIIPICEFLNVSMEYLLTGKENNSNSTKLTENEKELLQVFKKYSDREQIKIIGALEANAPKEQTERNKLSS